MLLALQHHQKFSPGIWPGKHFSGNWQRSRHLYYLSLKKQLTHPGHRPWISNLNPPQLQQDIVIELCSKMFPQEAKSNLIIQLAIAGYSLVIKPPSSHIFRICSDACSEEQKAKGKGNAHTVSLWYQAHWTEASEALLQRGAQHQTGKRSCLADILVISGFGLLHGETRTECLFWEFWF